MKTNEIGRFEEIEKQLALDVLRDVNRLLNQGANEYDGHPIQSAKENAVDGMIEAGFTRKEINILYNSI